MVCKGCGSEVSPYVTECPYCARRLRKRAPKIERTEAGLEVRAGRRARLPRPSLAINGERPLVTIAVTLGAAALLLVERATALTPVDLGALTPGAEQWWRYLAAPLVHESVGYLFVVAATLAVFGAPLERRLGHLPLAVLALGCGALGMLVAGAVEPALVATGGNGVALGLLAAWLGPRELERRRGGEDFDWIGVAVFAAVLLALPLVADGASVWAGLGGGAVGAVAGLLTARLGPR